MMTPDPATTEAGGTLRALATILVMCGGSWACGGEADGGPAPPNQESALYEDVTESHLPVDDLRGLSMDARAADLDADDDLDIVIANEFRPNILLINDGTGRFTDESDTRLPRAEHDSEDVGVADFDGDGDLDIVVVSEDDQINELYFNRGDGTFTDEGGRLPVTGTSNAVIVADVNGDGGPDILIGNNGRNAVLVNDGAGGFTDGSAARLPEVDDVTQDLELGDADGDGDLDLLVANEGRNRLLINDGTGVFREDPAPGGRARIPERMAAEESREGDFGDVDGDGDLDVFFANVAAFVPGADPANRLLINDGTGFFTDETDDRLPGGSESTFDGDFFDVDGDGDLDLLTSNSDVDLSAGRIADAPYRVFLNDGSGTFTASESVLPEGTVGTGFDAIFHDVDGDGRNDLFLASRGSADRLLLRR